MGVIRAFIAIELPLRTQEAIQKQTARLRQTFGDRQVRWVPADNLHLTLKFLGDVESAHLDFITQMLSQTVDSYTEFEIRFSGLGSFPTSKRPRVLWIGLQFPASLVSLQREIESSAERLGYKKEERGFSPHLTIGRVRQDASAADLQQISKAIESIQLGHVEPVKVDSIHLFKSDLKPSGAIYTSLFSTNLKNASTVAVEDKR